MEEHITKNNTYGFTDTRREGQNYYISFLVWPFGVLLAALKHWRKPWSKNVFWLFCIFFGLTYIIAEEGGGDSDRYNRLFVTFAHSNLSLPELWSSFYSEGSKFADIASPLIIFLVSRITDNASILFAVFGLIFGYFYSRNIWYVLDQIRGKFTFIDLLYILTMVLLIPIWGIGNFRFYLAAHVFLYSALPYFLEKNKKRLILLAVTVFIHWSFVFPVAVFILFIFLKNKLNIFYALFIITVFIKELNLEFVRSLLSSFLPDFLPEVYDRRILAYTNISYAESIIIRDQSLNWYLTYSGISIKWVVYSCITFIYFFGRKILKDNPNLMTLLCFSLLLYGLGNILSLVPSGGRFIIIANTFLFPFFILFMNSFSGIKGLLILRILTIPALLLYCIVELRIGMDVYGLMTIIGNPIIALLNIDSSPLIIGIKRLIL